MGSRRPVSIFDRIFSSAINTTQVSHEGHDHLIIDLQVGKTVHQDVPARLRRELWMSVLHRHPGLGAKAMQQYSSTLKKSLPEEVAENIAKDVSRTFPNVQQFRTPEGKASLHRLLRAYAAYDTEVNYCQGMNFVAGLLLLWLYPNEAAAFGALVVVMQERGLRHLYKDNLKMLQARLWQVGQLLPPRLTEHMEANMVTPVLYASSWLLTAYASDFPLFFSSRIMDVILTDSYIEPMMKVVLGILKRNEKVLLECNDMERLTYFLKAKVPKWPRLYLQDLLTEALAMEWTPAQDRVLKQIQDTESVVDAVRRVSSLSRDEGAAEAPQASASASAGLTGVGSARLGATRSTSISWASRLNSSISLPARPGTPCEAPQSHSQRMPSHSASLIGPPEGDGGGSHPNNLADVEDEVPNGTADTSAGSAALPLGDVSCELPRAASLAGRSSAGSFGDFVTPEPLDRRPASGNTPGRMNGSEASEAQRWLASGLNALASAAGSSTPEGGAYTLPDDWNSDFWTDAAEQAEDVAGFGVLDRTRERRGILPAPSGLPTADDRAPATSIPSAGARSTGSSVSFSDFQSSMEPRGLHPIEQDASQGLSHGMGAVDGYRGSLLDDDHWGGPLKGLAISQLDLEGLSLEMASESSPPGRHEVSGNPMQTEKKNTSKLEAELSRFTLKLAQNTSMQSQLPPRPPAPSADSFTFGDR